MPSIYQINYNAPLGQFHKSQQEIDWLLTRPGAGSFLLVIQEDFPLKNEHLKWVSSGYDASDPRKVRVASIFATTVIQSIHSILKIDFSESLHKARIELVDTGEIKGKLFLTPCLNQVWISHYDIQFLKEIS